MDSTSARRPRHRTVDRIAAILEAVANSAAGLTLTQLAVRLEAPVSSIQKLVNGLVAAGYLDEEDHRFLLGPAPHVLSMRSGRVPVRSLAHADLAALSERSGTPALLAVRVGDNAVYVDWAGTDEPFEYALSKSLRSALPRTAAGQVLLAHLPERDRRAVVSAVLGDDTAAAVGLLTDAEQIRSRGFAVVSSGHVMRSVTAVAVPVVEEGRVVAALAIADHADTVSARLDEFVALLSATA